MKKLLLFLLPAVLLGGCNNDSDGPVDPPAPSGKPVWETYTHAALLMFKGKVKQVREYVVVDEIDVEQLVARFDAAGNCTFYNPTGIDPQAQVSTYDWGVKSAWYAYQYDAQGRMGSVTSYEVGAEPLTYTITYGAHESYVATPFPLGDIEPFMLKGVTRIEADGYELTSDGKTAEEVLISTGWGAATTHTNWVLTGGMPVASEAVTTRNGEEMNRISTVYTYKNNWLVGMETVFEEPEMDPNRTVIEFSTVWPCSPSSRTEWIGSVTEPQSRIEYRYGENGLPVAVASTIGTSIQPIELFEQWYNTYDAAGNWTSSTKRMEDGEQILSRELGYY